MVNDSATRVSRRVIAVLAAFAAAILVASSPYAPPANAATAAVSYAGQATFYESVGGGTTNGNCSFPKLPSNNLYVALGPSEYKSGAMCGSYIDVTGSKGTVRVIVMDQCPECGPNHLDLSKTAFAKIADVRDGLVPIKWRTVKNPTTQAMSFRFKDGASQWWFALQVINHGNMLTRVEVRVNGSWKTTKRVDYGYWIYEPGAGPGAGPGPYTVRITDRYGQQVTVSGIKMQPMVVQKTTARLYPA